MLRHYGYSFVGASLGWSAAALATVSGGPDALPILCCGLAIPLTLSVFCDLRGLALIVVAFASMIGAFVVSAATSEYWLDRFMRLETDPVAFFQPVTTSVIGAIAASVLALFAFSHDLKER
jgi:hypothetical protein